MASEENIQMLMTVISGISRDQCRALLNRNNNDINQAVNLYYEDPTTALQSISTSWAEPPPYSSVNDNEFQAYNIHAPDVNHSAGGHATAPSRPPSRISTHGDIQDLTELHAAADPNERLTEKERNDPLIQEERQRLNGMRYTDGQTTGVTSSGQSFRKVDNNHPDTGQWVMTTSSAVTPDLPPEHRRRREGDPVFLRSPGGDSCLGPLLTIYHAIPLARDALLFKRFPKRDGNYGIEPQWWNGESIVQVRIIDNDGEDEETANAYEVVHEVQRLMAFLDGTDRAFGSTSPLSKMASLAAMPADPHDPFSDSDVYKLLQFWRGTVNESKTIGDPADFETVFESRAMKMALDHPEGVPPQTKTFNLIGGPEVNTGRGETLYDELDRFIWKDYVGQPIDDVWIDELAEIVTFRFGHENRKGDGLEIPAVWYPDRYLRDGRDAARRMREQKLSIMQEAYEIDQSKRKLLHQVVNGEARNVRDDLMAAVDAAEITAQGSLRDNSVSKNGKTDNNASRISAAEAETCIARLKAMVDRIDKKVHLLEEQYQRALDFIQQNAHRAAQAAGSIDAPHKHKYTLRGVSTHPHVTYVLCPTNSEPSPGEQRLCQWYRISFSVKDGQEQRKQLAKEAAKEAARTSGTNLQQGWESLKVSEEIPGYTVRSVSENDVLKAAKDESKTVLLVYASERAISHASTDLSRNPQLQQFVEMDNRNFAAELRGLDPLHTDISIPLDPNPNTASTGSSRTLSTNPFSPADGETDPLIDTSRNRQGSSAQSGASSATLHSVTNSITRSEDGQASPKRPKGYDDRIPTSLEESEMDETVGASTRGIEMQEKAGTGLLGLGAAGAIAKAAAQSPKGEEEDVEMQHAFQDVKINPSYEIITRLPETLPTNDGTGTTRSLLIHPTAVPVIYKAVQTLIPQLLSEHHPDVVLHLGLDTGRDYFALEASAPRDGYHQVPDTERKVVTKAEIKSRWGKLGEHLTTTVDREDVVRRLCARLARHTKNDRKKRPIKGDAAAALKSDDFPVRLTDDVATYICGFIYYTSLAWYSSLNGHGTGGENRPVVFLHVPPLPTEKDLEPGTRIVSALLQALAESEEERRAGLR